MKISVITPAVEVPSETRRALEEAPKVLELAGRTCYKSEDRITDTSAEKFVKMICKNHHESVLEHVNLTAKFILSRSASHQLVRHRLASYSQESQRYCNYGKRGLQVICPPTIGVPTGTYDINKFGFATSLALDTSQRSWLQTRALEYEEYLDLIDEGIPPEDSRYSLPNATKTEIVVTMNARSWRHVFKERAFNRHAQWEIRYLMLLFYETCNELCPCVFGGLDV